MPNSGEYYNLYKLKKSEAEKYENQIKELNKIFSSLINNFSDDRSGINSELEKLAKELKSAVKGSVNFDTNADNLNDHYEKATTVDTNLNNTYTGLDNEINSLSQKMNAAAKDRDDYYRLYQQKKAEEEAERRRREEEEARRRTEALKRLMGF